jgi:isopentenyldiphosphate isomerase
VIDVPIERAVRVHVDTGEVEQIAEVVAVLLADTSPNPREVGDPNWVDPKDLKKLVDYAKSKGWI